MITTQKMLQIDPGLADLSETELEEVREALYSAAQLAFDVYWTRKHGSKDPTGSLDNYQISDTVESWNPNDKKQG